MSDDQIIASMVKGRECCRQLVRAYETARTGDISLTDESDENVGLLAMADTTLSRMLNHFKDLPDKLGSNVQDKENREYAMRLLGEIGDLLQKAMVLEREMRNAKMNYPHLSGGAKNMSGHPSMLQKAYAA